ncbi:hypothetical protein [Providencia stuartii]|uniref:hypothetical protein n=1 Tax=Providencia stuartii TaxID=588 RepID=UPI002989E5DC|nr:hypothetical protein [Providencia stuartii]
MQVRFLEWIKNQLDVNSTMPLYRQLQQAIESAIEHKIVDAGDYLPAERYSCTTVKSFSSDNQ